MHQVIMDYIACDMQVINIARYLAVK